jgi:hypothetical protein
MAADVAALRTMFNLPEQAPAELLDTHIGMAAAKLERETALSAAPAGHEADWDQAILYAALASVLPWLHSFYLSGAAPVMRLLEGIEMRFMTPAEQRALIELAEGEYAKRKHLIIGEPATEAPFAWGAL